MSNASNPVGLPFGLTPRGDNASTGIAACEGGAFCALTMTESKTFRTVKGAAAWLAKRGYSPTGARLAAVAS